MSCPPVISQLIAFCNPLTSSIYLPQVLVIRPTSQLGYHKSAIQSPVFLDHHFPMGLVRFFHPSSPQDFQTTPLGHVAPRAVRGRSGWSVDWTSARARRARDCRCGRRPRCAKTSAEAQDDATMEMGKLQLVNGWSFPKNMVRMDFDMF